MRKINPTKDNAETWIGYSNCSNCATLILFTIRDIKKIDQHYGCTCPEGTCKKEILLTSHIPEWVKKFIKWKTTLLAGFIIGIYSAVILLPFILIDIL